jgi:DNA polymerase III delta subunit
VGHLIVGEDTYLGQQRREEIIKANVPAEARDFAVARFSLNRSPLGDILARARILPMLSPKQVIVITDVDAMREVEVGELEEYLAAPVDFTVLVFEVAKLDRRTRVARLSWIDAPAWPGCCRTGVSATKWSPLKTGRPRPSPWAWRATSGFD